MYKLIVVDDEPLIIAGIKSMIDWDKYNIDIVGSASNGEQALKLIENVKPDIVITDIKMPVFTGLQLIERCQSMEDQSIKFIVLSSYEDFNIARQAMRFNTVDYLVKLELTPDILIDSVNKALSGIIKTGSNNGDKLNSATKIFKEIFYIKLLNNVFIAKEDVLSAKKIAGVDLEGLEYSVIYSRITYNNAKMSEDDKNKSMISTIQVIKEVMERSVNIYILPMDAENFVTIVGAGQEQALVLKSEDELGTILKNCNVLAEKYFNIGIDSGIGSICYNIQDISTSYKEARAALSYCNSEDRIIVYKNIQESDIKVSHDDLLEKREKLKLSLESYDIELFTEIIDIFITKLDSEEALLSESFNICSSILFEIMTYMTNAEELLQRCFREEKNGYYSLYEMTSVKQTIDWIKKIRAGFIEEFKEKRTGYTELLADQIRKYIDRNCLKKIELKDLGLHFNMSPNYLCSVFKKHNNYGVSYYHNLKRIEKAKDLLKQKVYKMYDISEMTGFESQYYFSKVFKKITGVSPSAWLADNECNV
ncbi:response regulator [Spirochaeta cellobiosiphila]|uniref:response regulator n=1 Tax=Spirochaeta cellobiosiphila TaxID=504483 RepID=UPI00041DD961|nr:response regulator [Spirochaeta cellobiosiphila]